MTASRRSFLGLSALALPALAVAHPRATPAGEGWEQVRARYRPDHPDWPAVIRNARQAGYNPDDVDGFSTSHCGPHAGWLGLCIVDPRTGADIIVDREEAY